MDREELARMLGEGLSQSEIGRRVGLHQSTVSYWCRKHGLDPGDAHRRDYRGAIPRERYAELVERHLTIREIATELDRSATTVRYWLEEYGLKTTPTARQRAKRTTAPREQFLAPCRIHGEAVFVHNADGTSACTRCRAAAVSDYRRRVKARLVEEAGGACVRCGYDGCIAALQFHHRDPATKRFGLGSRGLARPYERLRKEAAKCDLLCATCHAEVEAGYTRLAS